MPKVKRILLILYFICIAGISVWVPWKLMPPVQRVVEVPIGYSLIWSPPTTPVEGSNLARYWSNFAVIDGKRILLETVCLSAFFGVGWLLLTAKKQLQLPDAGGIPAGPPGNSVNQREEIDTKHMQSCSENQDSHNTTAHRHVEKEAPGLAEAENISVIRICRTIAIAVKRQMQRMEPCLSSDFNSAWDEFCDQVQGVESIYYDNYVETARGLILPEVIRLHFHEIRAIWNQMDSLDPEASNDIPDDSSINEEPIGEFILEHYLLKMAGSWEIKEVSDLQE